MVLRVTCPECGERDAPGARFCRTCGTALQPSSDAALRRFVAVVRSDIQGSTGLGERHDPELLQHVLTRYYDAARSACTYHGGTIEQIQGDAVVAIFDGHEDDALRAVRAATELRDRMTRLNEELERAAAIRLPIRMAVECGEVVAGSDGPGQLTGEVMNIVAHLERTAGPGEILLGETAHRLVREAADVEEIGPLVLKGKQRPVHAYRLQFLRPGAAGRVHLAVPMVGRQLELALLTAAFGRSAGDRSCQLVTLFGPAGVGKSRLIEALLDSVQQRATVLRGRCPSYGGVAYDAMIQVVAEAARLDLADPGTARRRLAAVVTGIDGSSRIVERISQVLGLRKGGGPAEDTHWALRRLLEVIARDRPLIVVLEDLHWADPALLDLVEEIADSSRDAPLLLLCASRLELLDARPRWAGGKVNALSIQLAPLGGDDAKQLVSRLLGDMATAPGVREYIVDQAGGNPLFVQGLVAMLREKRLLRVDAGRWRTAVEELEAPRDIQALVNARLMHLGAAERRVVERAAIIGRRFTKAAVLELSPAAERPEVAAGLRTLVRKSLIVPDPDSPVGPRRDDGYVFTHALIQEVAYHAIAKETRAELHERFADWLERSSGGDVAQLEEIVGDHLKRAYGCLVDLRRNDRRTARLARRAGEALAEAGHRATVRRDIPEFAVSLLRQAESLLQDNDEIRRAALLDLGDALRDSASTQEALDAYERAITAARVAGDARRATHGFLGVLETRGFLRPGDERIPDQDAKVEDALRLFDRLSDDRGLARAWQAKAYAHWTAGRLTDAEAACRKAIDFAQRAGDEQLEAAAVSSRCFILFWGPEPFDEVRREVEDALGWARRRGIRRLEVDAMHILARISAMRERFAEARALLRQADVGTKAQPRDLLVRVGRFLSVALVELMAGEPAAAERVLRRSHQELTELKGIGQLHPVIILLARALIMQGRDEEAMRQINDYEELALTSRDAEIKWRALRALLLARRGEAEAAMRLAAEAVALTADWEQDDSTAEVDTDYAHVLRLAGKDREARQMAERALARYQRKGNLVGARRAEAFLGRHPVTSAGRGPSSR
jgi:class 3 adenylate cyclase/tetratricopeptide (TPR) repeat protein